MRRMTWVRLPLVLIAATALLSPISSAAEVAVPRDDSLVQNNGPVLVGELQDVLGSQFGGAWIEHSAGSGILHVGVAVADSEQGVAAATLDTIGDAASEYGLSGTIAIDSVPYSIDELGGMENTLAKIIGSSTDGILGWGVSAKLNKVELMLSEPQPALVDEISNVIPPAALEVIITPGQTMTAAYSRQEYPPFKGAKHVEDSERSWSNHCTTGFVYTFNANGLKQGSTAGHCAMDNDWMYGNYPAFDQTIGVSHSNTLRASNPAFGDSAMIGLSDQSDATKHIIESTTKQRLVTAKFSLSGLIFGVTLYKSGKSGGTDGGYITAGYGSNGQTRTIWFQNMNTGVLFQKTVNHLVCANIPTSSGDSGGPVYARVGSDDAKAAGQVSAVRVDSNNNFVEMCFDPVRNIEINSGVTLWQA